MDGRLKKAARSFFLFLVCETLSFSDTIKYNIFIIIKNER